MEENLVTDNKIEDIVRKKRKVKFMAGTITFFVFVFWLIYFVGTTRSEYGDTKPFALFEDMKQNGVKPIEDMMGFFNEVKNNLTNIGATTTVINTRTTIDGGIK